MKSLDNVQDIFITIALALLPLLILAGTCALFAIALMALCSK